jgi:hypothetical protein
MQNLPTMTQVTNQMEKNKPTPEDILKMIKSDDIEVQNIKSNESLGKISSSNIANYEYVKLNDLNIEMPLLLHRLINNLSVIHKNKSVPPIMLTKNIDGSYTIQDGRHRSYVCKLFGYTFIPAIITDEILNLDEVSE